MPRDPGPARQRLLDAALALFAEKGIAATSLREIRLRAGQHNNFAAQYHFGDKDGVLRALLEREIPWLVERRRQLLADAHDAETFAAVWVQPFAELATGTDRERSVVRLVSNLQNDVSRSMRDVLDLTGDTGTEHAYAALRTALAADDDPYFQQRLFLAINGSIHIAALWATGRRPEYTLDAEQFHSTLVTMFLGAVAADGAPTGS